MAKIVLGIGITVAIIPNVIWNLKRQLILGILKQNNLKQSVSFHPLIFLTDILALGRGEGRGGRRQKTAHCVLKSSIPDSLVHVSKEGRIGPCWESFFFWWHLKLLIKLCLIPFSSEYCCKTEVAQLKSFYDLHLAYFCY